MKGQILSKLQTFKNRTKRKIIKCKIRLNQFYQNNDTYFSYISDFIRYVFLYGLLFNYALWIVRGIEINLLSVPGWGIAFYFLKEEMPEIIQKCKG